MAEQHFDRQSFRMELEEHHTELSCIAVGLDRCISELSNNQICKSDKEEFSSIAWVLSRRLSALVESWPFPPIDGSEA
jgi:hypothetical protein